MVLAPFQKECSKESTDWDFMFNSYGFRDFGDFPYFAGLGKKKAAIGNLFVQASTPAAGAFLPRLRELLPNRALRLRVRRANGQQGLRWRCKRSEIDHLTGDKSRQKYQNKKTWIVEYWFMVSLLRKKTRPLSLPYFQTNLSTEGLKCDPKILPFICYKFTKLGKQLCFQNVSDVFQQKFWVDFQTDRPLFLPGGLPWPNDPRTSFCPTAVSWTICSKNDWRWCDNTSLDDILSLR